MSDKSQGDPPPKKSIGELKKSKGFDEFLAESIAHELRQPEALGIPELIKEIKRRVNPGLHNLLDDDTGGPK